MSYRASLRVLVACLVALGMAACFPALSSCEEEGAGARYGVVITQRLNLREAPIDGAVIATYDDGTRLKLLELSGAWYKAEAPDGTVGYVSSDYINPITEAVVSNGGDFVNLRAEPSLTGEVLGQVLSGTPVEVYAHQGDWSLVSVNGTTGYMASYFLSPTAGATARPSGYTPAASVNPSLENPYRFDMDGEQDLVQEYGLSESFVDFREGFSCTVVYPVSGLVTGDTQIRAWAKKLVRDAERMVLAAEEEMDVEMMVTYNAYVVDGRYVGILESGWLQSSLLEQPQEIVYVMNIDLANGRLLTYRDILNQEGIEQVLQMLGERLSKIGGKPLSALNLVPDERWLSHLVICPEGIAVLLPQEEFLPAALGTQRLLFSYEELGEAGLLAIEQPAAASPEDGTGAMLPISASGERVIDPNRPMVALTFDDGPSDTTPKILALLEQYGGRATFFVVGNRIANYETQLAQIAAQGSEIGCHTWSHRQLTSLGNNEVRSQIEKTVRSVEARTGQTVRLMRPPYGSHNSAVRSVCKELGLSVVLWSIDTEDWRTRDAQATYDTILENVQNGSIILCHDLHEPTGEAMERVIPELVRRGYQLVTVSELLSFQAEGAVAGQAYYDAAPQGQ